MARGKGCEKRGESRDPMPAMIQSERGIPVPVLVLDKKGPESADCPTRDFLLQRKENSCRVSRAR
jgi:hypothetical protein